MSNINFDKVETILNSIDPKNVSLEDSIRLARACNVSEDELFHSADEVRNWLNNSDRVFRL